MASITIINQFYVPDISPTAHLAASLAEHLAGQGHDVRVVTSRSGYVADKAARAKEASGQRASTASRLRIHRLWSTSLGKATHLRRLLDYVGFYVLATGRMLTLPRQDVIISLTTPPFIAWTGVAHRLLHRRSKLVLWCMDCYPDAAERMNVIREGGLLSRTLRLLNRAMFRRLDHLIVLDTAMGNLLLSQYQDRRRPLPTTVIPNWEKASLFPREQASRHQGAQASNDAAANSFANDAALRDRFVVLYLGNMGYGHHFDAVLKAAESLRHTPVTFLFVGGGKRKDELEQEAKARNLSNVIVRAYIPKEQTPHLMSRVDAALITLRDDVLGVMSPSKLHSNLAMGLPIVYLGPETSNVDDAIQRFKCGVSLPANDVTGLVRFLNSIVDRGEKFQQMRRSARQAFDEAYCDERTLPQFSGVVSTLLGVETQAATTRAPVEAPAEV